ncbi:MAG: L,D-transpeptidase family protein [Rhodospirillaceae bacterium]
MSLDVLDVIGGKILIAGARQFACAIGKGGLSAQKVEGDGATPIGRFALRRGFWRADRLERPVCPLTMTAIDSSMGWCDDPKDSAYNRQVALPYAARHEVMQREDQLYDVVIVLGHNDDPVIPGAGSAVFLHVAKPDYAPTEGCVALALADLLSVLPDCDTETALVIHPAE